jgi:hypothetical protein
MKPLILISNRIHIVIRLTHETPIIILFVEDINISHLTNILNRNKNEEKKEFNELLILNNSIKFVIEEIRKTSFLSVDNFNSSLIKFLKELKGLNRYEEYDFYLDSKRNQ